MRIFPNHKWLSYKGRIDQQNSMAPKLIFPYTAIEFCFEGTGFSISFTNEVLSLNNYIGVIIDGTHYTKKLKEGYQAISFKNLSYRKHEVVFFKRQDACHVITIRSIDISGELLEPKKEWNRRLLFFGDSVTAGEVSEAIEQIGMVDPIHQGEYSNSYYSYASITARKLCSEVHLIAQGGIALQDGVGYFPVGMITAFDKSQYNPDYGDFVTYKGTYIPQIIVVAIGQNDAHPYDFMRLDYNSLKSQNWREEYKSLILRIMKIYEETTILITTTILKHDSSWDKALDEVVSGIDDSRVKRFKYSRNGSGTPGHLRISEAEEMALELTDYIEGLGESIWS